MGEDQRIRQRWLETAIIFGAWSVFGLITASQLYMQLEARGLPIPPLHALGQGLLEGYISAITTVAVFWLARRFRPLPRASRFCRRGEPAT